MSCNFDFSGRKILVTGASKGIGRAVALALARSSADVFALGRDADALESLKSESGGKVTPVVLDVTAGKRLVADALAPFQPFDGLVNSAGIAICDPFLHMKEDDFKSVLNTNLVGAAIVSQVVAEGMIRHKPQGSKSIVHISSLVSNFTAPDHTAYAASKAGLDSLCRSAALELAEHGIRVNTVNPTVVMTEMGRRAWDNESQRTKDMMARIPLRRWAEVGEVVASVLWLLSDGSNMTTGGRLPVDGGAGVS